MPAQDDTVNLHNLPSDIVRRVVGMDRGSSQSMRFISNRWNNLVTENLSEGKNCPSIDWFSWSNFENNVMFPLGSQILMKIRVKSEYVTYFGLDTFSKFIRRCSPTEIPRPKQSDEIDLQRYFIKSNLPDFTQLFKRCSKINRFELESIQKEDPDDIKVVTDVLKNVNIDTFALTGSAGIQFVKFICKQSELYLIDLFRGKKVRYLHLSTGLFRPAIFYALVPGIINQTPCERRCFNFVMKAVQLVEEIRLEFYENMEYNTYIYHRLLEVINKSGKVSAELNVAELGGNNKIFQFTLVAAQQ